MRVLLTGGNGFVGRHLVKYLVQQGHQVCAPIRSAEAPDNRAGIWYLNCNFDSLEWIDELLARADAVIHAAAYAHQTRRTDSRDKLRFHDVNCELSVRLFERSRLCGARQFIFISSIGALRSFADEVVTEKSEPRPSDDYGASKLAAEKALSEAAASGEMALTIVRPCLVYGPGNPGNMARLSRLLDLGLPLPFAGIWTRRSFLFVGNLVHAIEQCLLNPSVFGEHFIVCDEEAPSLPELLQAIAAARGTQVRLFSMSADLLRLLGKTGDILARVLNRPVGIDSYSVERIAGGLECDGSKLRDALGCSPPFSFNSGIERTFSEN